MIFQMTFTRRKWAHVCRLLGSSGSDKRPCQWWDILAWYHHKVTGLLISNTPAVCCNSNMWLIITLLVSTYKSFQFCHILLVLGSYVEWCRGFLSFQIGPNSSVLIHWVHNNSERKYGFGWSHFVQNTTKLETLIHIIS